MTDIVVLDFDHQRDKEVGVNALVGAGAPWDRNLVEIEKCEVVCANDDRRRTARTFRWARLDDEQGRRRVESRSGDVIFLIGVRLDRSVVASAVAWVLRRL
ncbi:hypothetical protein [Micromonospora sp. NPDC005161]